MRVYMVHRRNRALEWAGGSALDWALFWLTASQTG